MLYISPAQFDNAMIEINIAFDIVNKRIDMIQEENRALKDRLDELEKSSKTKTTKTQ